MMISMKSFNKSLIVSITHYKKCCKTYDKFLNEMPRLCFRHLNKTTIILVQCKFVSEQMYIRTGCNHFSSHATNCM